MPSIHWTGWEPSPSRENHYNGGMAVTFIWPTPLTDGASSTARNYSTRTYLTAHTSFSLRFEVILLAVVIAWSDYEPSNYAD